MGFNSSKFKLMRYTVRKNQIDFDHKMKGCSTIARENNKMDLGVVIPETAKFLVQNKKAAQIEDVGQDGYAVFTHAVVTKCLPCIRF